jgi:hypothetical protein
MLFCAKNLFRIVHATQDVEKERNLCCWKIEHFAGENKTMPNTAYT